MARVLTLPQKTAKIANTDLEMHLDFREPADPENVVIDDMKVVLRIKYDDGSVGTSPPVKVADFLDNVTIISAGTQLANFRQALIALRDAAFDAAGLTDV